MSEISSIALIGLGEVGQILAADLAAAGVADITACDVLLPDPHSSPSKAAVPVRKCPSLAEALVSRDLVISAVTATSDLAVATHASSSIPKDAFFLDLNSVSPWQKQSAAATINDAGGRYVEAAVMAPFTLKRITSPMLLGGPFVDAFLSASQKLGFRGDNFSESYGPASATKMCRSVIIKGVEALLAEALLSARYYGVEKSVLHSLSDLLPVGDWPKLATYMISRSLEHGQRRSEEMREAAKTVAQAGIAPLMSTACVERQAWAAAHRQALSPELGEMLDAMLGQGKNRR